MEDDISPWRQTEHDNHHPHPQHKGISPSKIIPSSMPYFDLTANAFLNTRKVPLGIPVALPQLYRSKSLGVGLPKLSSKPQGFLDKRGSFRSGHLHPLQKNPQLRVRKGSISQASTGLLRTKLESLLKQHETSPSSSPLRFCRNFSEVQAKGSPIVRQKNIVFLYSPPSDEKQPVQSPKKRHSGHILDKLLSDWK